MEDGGGWLPGFVGDVVVGVDGEVVGLVGVVLAVRVEGADPDLAFGSQVGDVDGFAGLCTGTAVDRPGGEGSQLAEGPDPRTGLGAAVGADEVVLEAAGHGAELGRRGGVGDDAI